MYLFRRGCMRTVPNSQPFAGFPPPLERDRTGGQSRAGPSPERFFLSCDRTRRRSLVVPCRFLLPLGRDVVMKKRWDGMRRGDGRQGGQTR